MLSISRTPLSRTLSTFITRTPNLIPRTASLLPRSSRPFSSTAFTMAPNAPNIDLYTAQTPNGSKISITLEELGLPYNTHVLNLRTNEQKSEEFVKINPNGRIPAITDTFKDGKSISIFESGSIQQYLVEEYDTEYKISYPKGTREHYEVNSWLFFLNAGVGPMQGQANWFLHMATEKVPLAIERYQNEARRLYGVLNTHLEGKNGGYLVGDKCTIADIAHYGWVRGHPYSGLTIDSFPELQKWLKLMETRPAVLKGRDVPAPVSRA